MNLLDTLIYTMNMHDNEIAMCYQYQALEVPPKILESNSCRSIILSFVDIYMGFW